MCIPLTKTSSDKTFAACSAVPDSAETGAHGEEEPLRVCTKFRVKNSHAAWHNLEEHRCLSPRNGLGPRKIDRFFAAGQQVQNSVRVLYLSLPYLVYAAGLCIKPTPRSPQVVTSPQTSSILGHLFPQLLLSFFLSVTTFPLYSSLPFAKSRHGSPHSR